jgi:hypothetical protein
MSLMSAPSFILARILFQLPNEIGQYVVCEKPEWLGPDANLPLDPCANANGLKRRASKIVEAISPANPIYVEHISLDLGHREFQLSCGNLKIRVNEVFATLCHGSPPDEQLVHLSMPLADSIRSPASLASDKVKPLMTFSFAPAPVRCRCRRGGIADP